MRRLRPWHANVGKRLVKSPKVYLRDTGLLHSLLGIDWSVRALLAHPKAGASFETFCIDQLLAHARLRDPAAEVSFYRTQTGVEVDVLLSFKRRLIPIEIKLGTAAPSTRHLEICMEDLGLSRGFVVWRREGLQSIARGIEMGGLSDILAALELRR